MRILIIIGGALALAACGGSDTTTIETEDGTIEYDSDSGDGEFEARFTDGEGNEAVMTSGSDVEADLPDGFSVYPGAEVISNTVMHGNDGEGSVIIMMGSDSADEMSAYYRSEAEDAGFTITMEMTTGETRAIGGQAPNGSSFSFNASTSDGETSGILTISREGSQ